MRAREIIIEYSLIALIIFGAYSIGYYLKIQETPKVLSTTIAVNDNLEGMEKIITDWQNKLSAKSSVYVSSLKTGKSVLIDAEKPIVSASLYKFYVAYQLLKMEDNNPNTLKKVMSNGLDAEECLRQMIVISQNECSEILGAYVGWANVDRSINKMGLKSTTVNNYRNGGGYNGDKKTSSSDVGEFLEKLYRGELLSKKSTSTLIKYMTFQELNERIPEVLPSGVTIAHKTGTLQSYRHDAGYIFGSKGDDLVYVVMTHSWDENGLKNSDNSIKQLVTQIVKENEN